MYPMGEKRKKNTKGLRTSLPVENFLKFRKNIYCPFMHRVDYQKQDPMYLNIQIAAPKFHYTYCMTTF